MPPCSSLVLFAGSRQLHLKIRTPTLHGCYTSNHDATCHAWQHVVVCSCTLRARNRVQCGIIYCLSRNETEKVASELERMFRPDANQGARMPLLKIT
jgi:superfamily II DNA helicase RecQ